MDGDIVFEVVGDGASLCLSLTLARRRKSMDRIGQRYFREIRLKTIADAVIVYSS
jgi:hypothetical protein